MRLLLVLYMEAETVLQMTTKAWKLPSMQRQGSYRQDCVKFKDFSRTSKRLYYCFQGLKT